MFYGLSEFQYVESKIAAVLSQPQYVKRMVYTVVINDDFEHVKVIYGQLLVVITESNFCTFYSQAHFVISQREIHLFLYRMLVIVSHRWLLSQFIYQYFDIAFEIIWKLYNGTVNGWITWA